MIRTCRQHHYFGANFKPLSAVKCMNAMNTTGVGFQCLHLATVEKATSRVAQGKFETGSSRVGLALPGAHPAYALLAFAIVAHGDMQTFRFKPVLSHRCHQSTIPLTQKVFAAPTGMRSQSVECLGGFVERQKFIV